MSTTEKPASPPSTPIPTERYTFPTTSDERIALLVSFLVGAAVIAVSFVQVAAVASDAGTGLGALLEQSQTLRLLFFLLVFVWVLGSLGGWVYARFRAGTRLELGPELLRYEQPGLPVFGLLANALVVSWDHIDRVRVHRVRRGLVWSSELEVEVGRDAFRVNLDRAVRESTGGRVRLSGAQSLRDHPVVRTIVERSGREPES